MTTINKEKLLKKGFERKLIQSAILLFVLTGLYIFPFTSFLGEKV